MRTGSQLASYTSIHVCVPFFETQSHSHNPKCFSLSMTSLCLYYFIIFSCNFLFSQSMWFVHLHGCFVFLLPLCTIGEGTLPKLSSHISPRNWALAVWSQLWIACLLSQHSGLWERKTTSSNCCMRDWREGVVPKGAFWNGKGPEFNSQRTIVGDLHLLVTPAPGLW